MNMETQPSPYRFLQLGSGMIGELVKRLGEPKGKLYQRNTGDTPRGVVFLSLSTALVSRALGSLHRQQVGEE